MSTSIGLIICILPLTSFTGNILLQTTPSHMIGHLDKCLREASTHEGILEFRNEHFWTLGYNNLVGSIHVRVRRDANEQVVLSHLTNRLSNLVSDLTIQVFKDDWSWQSSPRLLLQHHKPNEHSSSLKYNMPISSSFNSLSSVNTSGINSTSSNNSSSVSSHATSISIAPGDRNNQQKLNHDTIDWIQNVWVFVGIKIGFRHPSPEEMFAIDLLITDQTNEGRKRSLLWSLVSEGEKTGFEHESSCYRTPWGSRPRTEQSRVGRKDGSGSIPTWYTKQGVTPKSWIVKQ